MLQPDNLKQRKDLISKEIDELEKYRKIYSSMVTGDLEELRNNLGISNLPRILESFDFSKNNRFIFFSRIIKNMFDPKLSKGYVIAATAKLATHLDIVYDVRDGRTGGSVYYAAAIAARRPVKYGNTPTGHFGKEKLPEDQPCLDCSGFVSWICFILGLYGGAANELPKGVKKRQPNNPGGGGQWNVYSKEFVTPVRDGVPQIGDFIYFRYKERNHYGGHIGIVTNVKGGNVTEITHSAPADHGMKSGVRSEGQSNYFTWLMMGSKNAVSWVYNQGEVSKKARYLLTRIT